jgi:hypothetical protein
LFLRKERNWVRTEEGVEQQEGEKNKKKGRRTRTTTTITQEESRNSG